SSVIEAIVNDCQLVLLPLKGDQFFNSKLIADDLKAGIEVNNRKDEDGFFEKEELLEAVKAVMVEVDKEPGKQIRENHKKWREFLLNKEIQDKFIPDLVAQLKSLA
ncbi:UDP rhamnose anthocyanidin-3-glucoside rhamnosyltransferase, partial [Trifolium pratense]